MSIPLPAFLLFFGMFSTVAVILIAKVRSDVKRSSIDAEPSLLPNARVAGTPRRTRFAQRFHEPGAYAYGIGLSAVVSVVVCAVLAFIHSRPSPPERRTYHIVDPLDGTEETRDLTEQELHDQYENIGESLQRIRAQHAKAPPAP